MDLNELFQGESNTLEYKRSRPEDGKKYLKTVSAFSNGSGGKIIFGIDDHTRSVTGIPDESIFSEMDALANVISDGIEPPVLPEIYNQVIDGKTLIIVEIPPGPQRPYYVRSMGIQRGTYMRVGGTSRPVESYMLKELILEGKGESFDRILLSDHAISLEEVEAFCETITKEARIRAARIDPSAEIRPLTRDQLISWNILMEGKDGLYPTLAFDLLAGHPPADIRSGVQCAVFKGTTRSVFVDRKTYEGPLYEQIDQAYDFVLRMIRMGAVIEGVVRQDRYEIPISAIRELISKAVCHRSYLQPAYIQVALYDDRLEITTPGMLSRGVTLEKMRQGFSRIRNWGIARILSYMGMIEGWGSSLPRIIQECAQYGLAEPELLASCDDFRVNIYRNDPIGGPADVTSGSVPKACVMKDDQREAETDLKTKIVWEDLGQEEKILELLRKEGPVTAVRVSELLGVKSRRAREVLSGLVKQGRIKMTGAARSTRYELADGLDHWRDDR